MSRIDELIAKFCPEGIEFKALGEIAELVRGNGMPKSDFTESGIGCIHYGQIYTYYGVSATETTSFVAPTTATRLAKVDKGDLIITNTSENLEDVCKAVAWLGESQIVTGGHATVIKHKQDPKYLAYFFRTPDFFAQKKKYATGTKVIDVSAKSLAKIRIPVPPLEVQREIVRVLDTFTKLEAELEAELEARRQQYGHYRDTLLSFGESITGASKQQATSNKQQATSNKQQASVRWVSLMSICMKTNNIKWKENADKDYAYIDLSSVNRANNEITETQTINTQTAPSRAQQIVLEDDVIFGTTRPTLKRFCYIPKKYDEQICSTGFCILRADKQQVLPKYLYFSITTTAFNDYVNRNQEGAGYPAISDAKVKSFKIPVPPLEEQERIVAILDKFDALVNDLSSGLPAEIKARRRQYEYYRDRLLSFREAA